MTANPASIETAISLAREGFTIVHGVIDDAQCEQLLAALEIPRGSAAPRRLLDVAPFSRLALDLAAHPALSALLPAAPRALQCTYFDKSGERNWSVGLHQDLSLPVPDAAGALPPGWRTRSHKDGIDFAQPPSSVLQRVVAVRVQLDASDAEGALEVVAGTHLRGRLDAVDREHLARHAARLPCPVPRGGALVLHPLLVHGSRRLRSAGRRRVLHFVFAPAALGTGTVGMAGVAA
jgi:hypothetical protein